jgi:hypothetical protein
MVSSAFVESYVGPGAFGRVYDQSKWLLRGESRYFICLTRTPSLRLPAPFGRKRPGIHFLLTHDCG